MIIDANTIFCENLAVRGAEVKSGTVILSALQKPGKAEPIPLRVMVPEGFAGGTSMTFTFQQADSEDGEFADVPGASFEMTANQLAKGSILPIRFVPAGVEKPVLRLAMTPTGTFTAGKITALIGREDVISL
ncbi:MAG: hypothetical protein PUB69_00385 [Desulfovibrionaceae bacterium]|nr:hypothetical protein [Desulfovibrionaceae bacterium]